jgi:hypothetical protein
MMRPYFSFILVFYAVYLSKVVHNNNNNNNNNNNKAKCRPGGTLRVLAGKKRVSKGV